MTAHVVQNNHLTGKALVLGGSGFIGQSMIAMLFGDRPVLIADRVAPAGPQNANITYLPLDFASGDFSSYLRGVNLIVHLISTVAPNAGTSTLVDEIAENLIPTVRLLDDVVRTREAPKLLFISSGGTVYGEGGRFPVTERDAASPICTYAAHKLAIEKYLHLYNVHHGLDYRIARLSNPYSSRAYTAGKPGAIPTFIEQMRKGKAVTVWGDGEQRRDFIHIDDAINAIGAILSYSGPERLFNVGTGIGTSVNELIALIASELGVISPTVRHIAARACDVQKNQLDISLLRTCTGWEPRIPLNEGIRRCIEER